MMRKTPQKTARGSDAREDIQYHKISAQNDEFNDMQVNFSKVK